MTTERDSVYPFRPSEPVCFVLGKRVKVVYVAVKK